MPSRQNFGVGARIGRGLGEGLMSIGDTLSRKQAADEQQQREYEKATLEKLTSGVQSGAVTPEDAMSATSDFKYLKPSSALFSAVMPSRADLVSKLLSPIEKAPNFQEVPGETSLAQQANALHIPTMGGMPAQVGAPGQQPYQQDSGDDSLLPSRSFGPASSPDFRTVQQARQEKLDSFEPKEVDQYSPLTDVSSKVFVPSRPDKLSGMSFQQKPTGEQEGISRGRAALSQQETEDQGGLSTAQGIAARVKRLLDEDSPEVQDAAARGAGLRTTAEETARQPFEQARQAEQRTNAAQVRGDTQTDRSYNLVSSQIEKLRTPIATKLGTLATATESLNQATPTADALVVPEVLSVMAGGQGSGLRMTRNEMDRIVGGRSIFESLAATLNHFQTDPSKANSITPAQRQQMRALLGAASGRLQDKVGAIERAEQNLISAGSSTQHRQILVDLNHMLDSIDSGKVVGGFEVIGVR